MNRRTYRGAFAALALAFGGTACGSEGSGLLSCGDELCGPRQLCDHSGTSPACVCLPGHTGTACDVCASGYRRTLDEKCVPIAIDCEVNPEICGAHGTCVSAGTSEPDDDSCDCDSRYAGRLCEMCDAGYQDNDLDETCEPDCSLADLDCPGGRICNDSSGLAVCACPEGTTGDDCELCALGYRSNGTSCVPTCALLGTACGVNERCSDEGDIARCECLPGYAGPDCTTCSEGYDDTLRAGECLPTCAASGLTCGAHATCADDIGFAYCRCEPGWAGATCDTCALGHEGPSCEECAAGYFRVGDAVCVADCNATGCDAARTCANEAGILGCVCPIGYQGDDCTECAVGFAADGSGHCIAAVSSGYTLIAAAAVSGREALVAIEPTTGRVEPLRTLDVGGLAYDPADQIVYMATGDRVTRLDLASGGHTNLSSLTQPATGAPLTVNLVTGSLLALDATGALVSIVPSSGIATTLGSTGLTATDLAFDSAGSRLLAATTTPTPALHAIDPSTAASTSVGALPANVTGLAFSGAGALYALQATQLSTGEARVATCRAAVANLGIEGYPRAAGTAVEPTAATLAVTLQNQRTAGVELVAAGLNGAASRRAVTIESDNPDAVFCLATDADAIDLTVPASAQFRALVYYSASGDLTVTVAPGFTPAATPSIHLGPGAAVSASDHAAVRVYTAAEWADRRLPTADLTTLLGAGALLELDPTDASVLDTVPLDAGVVPLGTMAPWVP